MGILRITVDHTVRIRAASARVHAVVRGSSTLAGGLAGRKAALVREIVADLARHGVTEDAIEVIGVRFGTGEMKLLRSQSVEISLVVSVSSNPLPEVLGTLSERPGVTVEHLEWVYEEFEASIPATAEAMTMARRKADAVAAAAGKEVTGIAQVSDSWSMPSPHGEFARGDALYARATPAGGSGLDFGLDLNATTDLIVHLSVDFELSS